ncbi:hypothetical protein C0Q70_07759 [Pomacea canaliculata]|uniref:Uncharacterized protein n=1 Tax=Pomacea canaliculata TaxID=400727 RepID=A0A2T7PFW4_POMCA|nr:hypothetical protein C0Q70_07759 [Pomacea canaliculata]
MCWARGAVFKAQVRKSFEHRAFSKSAMRLCLPPPTPAKKMAKVKALWNAGLEYTASDRLEKLVCECVWDSSSTDCDGYSFRRVDVCSLSRSYTQKAGDGVSSKVYQALQDTYFASSTSEAYLTLAESALKFHHNLAVPVIQAVVGFRTFRHFQLRCDHFGRLCVFSSAESAP